MLEGIFIGAAIGVLVFEGLRALSEDEGSLWSVWFHGIAGNGAIRGAVVGTIGGGVIGWSRGQVDSYEFQHDSEVDSIRINRATTCVPANQRIKLTDLSEDDLNAHAQKMKSIIATRAVYDAESSRCRSLCASR